MISIVSHPGTKYPSSDENYSPSVRYPEYQYDHIATQPNPVYEMVREVFAQAGLDREHFGTRAWNPLGDFVAPGSAVFVLCNFVYHRRFQETDEAFWSKCTHGSVLRAIVDYLLIAVGSRGRVAFGNAPVQSCEWERVLAETGAAAALRFYEQQAQPVEAKDLRLFIAHRDGLGRTLTTELKDEMQHAVEIDLKTNSLLAQLPGNGNGLHFRNTDYDAHQTESYHSADSHRYTINRAALEADVIFSLPKLKTHEKVGVTCGLKGFVGAVAHKDCLAHHRFGGQKIGGDEYPDGSAVRLMISRLNERAYSEDVRGSLRNAYRVIDRSLQRVMRRTGLVSHGGWHGNDTAWRMALDIAQIMHYADAAGDMRTEVQRKHLSFIDGVIGGEAEGPLAPTPVKSGTFVFSDNVAAGDYAACRLMGFKPELIPLIRTAISSEQYPLSDHTAATETVIMNGQRLNIAELKPVMGRQFTAPRGWRDYLKNGE